jgi:hypothetical protein
MAFAAAQWWKNADRSDWQNACNALEAAFAFGYYGSFQDSTTQRIASTTTAYAMTFDTTDDTWGVSIGSPTSKIVVANAGTYNLQWSGQLQNTNNADQDVNVWLRKGNGDGASVDISGSNGVVSVPASHGQVSGHTITGWNWVFTLAAGDYIQLMWCADSTAITLQAYAAQSNPTRPSTASIVATLTQVGAVR